MKLILLTIVFFVTSCSNIDNNSYLSSQNNISDKKKVQINKYVGWWIFGEMKLQNSEKKKNILLKSSDLNLMKQSY